MGILFKLFGSPLHCKSQNQINEFNREEDYNLDHYLNNEIKDDIIINNNLLCLKIYIIGSGAKKEYIINNIFKNKIDNSLSYLADKEFKTEQFHWIARIYDDGLFDENKCNKLREEIKSDKSNKENKILNYQVILCFGTENIKIITSHFSKLRRSRMIFVTDSEYDIDNDIDKKMDKRYATNIICKNISNEKLNSKLITALWELDCCFKERGKQICRYTPEKIFNGLEKDNSLFSINILLTGLARTGKSTFINLLSGKILALESDASESVTKNISEYYIYKDDDKDEHGAIKLIDTPGILPNELKKEYKNVEKKVINMIKDQDKDFNTQIHFIFFIIKKDDSLEGENILEFLKILNQSKCPVYFILNKVNENEDDFESFVDSKTEYLNSIGCKNLSNENNFISANFKEKIHGIDTIFTKINEYIKERNYLNKELGDKMKNLLNNFRKEVESNKFFISYFKDDRISIEESKLKIDFYNKMKEINQLVSKNDLFSKIKIDSLIDNGIKLAEKCRNVIISLSKLENIFQTSSGDVPVISIFQAFMVKEIGEGFGLDINILNFGTKIFIKNIKNFLTSMKNENIINNGNNNLEISEILGGDTIIQFLDAIEDKIHDKLEKDKKNLILSLVELINKIRELNINSEKKIKELELINRDLTLEIYEFCLSYFKKELMESDRLSFMVNYFNKFELLLKDIEYYINKKDWGEYNFIKTY